MKKQQHIFVLFLFCGAIQLGFCQEKRLFTNYFLKIYEADSLYLVKNYEKSHFILDSLFQKQKIRNCDDEYLLYIKNKIQLQQSINATEIAEKMVLDFGYSSNVFEDGVLKTILENSGYTFDFIDNVLFENSIINKEYAQQLDALNQKSKHASRNSGIPNMLTTTAKEIQETFVQLIEKYGFPSALQVGSIKNNPKWDVSFGFLYYRTKDTQFQEYLLQLFETALNNGECNPETYADFINLCGLGISEELYFGYINSLDKITEPKAIAFLNQKRKEIGLYSLEFAAMKYKALLEKRQ